MMTSILVIQLFILTLLMASMAYVRHLLYKLASPDLVAQALARMDDSALDELAGRVQIMRASRDAL